MSEEKIFQKALEKAQANGLVLHFSYRKVYQQILDKELPFWVCRTFIVWIPFAQAFWGEDEHWLCDCGHYGDEKHPCDIPELLGKHMQKYTDW